MTQSRWFWTAPPLPPRSMSTWNPRRLKHNFQAMLAAHPPPRAEDAHKSIAAMARAITAPGGSYDRFQESPQLQAMRRAAHRMAHADPASRAAWKAVSRARKQEHRTWMQSNIHKASQADWKAKRTVDRTTARRGWEHTLLHDPRWQRQLTRHFTSIFCKAPPQRTASRLQCTRLALARACKHTTWQPFSESDLLLATATWKRGKATGPDGIAHEALTAMMGDDSWKQRMQYLLNDFLYRGALPPQVAAGVTVLLPKTPGSPAGWGDTRPITLSSAVLKWFAQLLLLRGGRQLQEGDAHQWARRGRQGTELLVVLRRVMRMAEPP